MMQLTDSVIETVLQNTVWVSDENSTLIKVIVFAAVILGGIVLLSKDTRKRLSAGGCLALLVFMCSVIISRNNFMGKAINNGNWFVHTDVVEEVKVAIDQADGDRDYFMVLEKYRRVSLDDYEDAIQYYPGQRVYIVVVPKNGSYESTGVTFPADVYKYVGSH